MEETQQQTEGVGGALDDANAQPLSFEQLVKEFGKAIPKVGDIVEGVIIAASKHEVLVDIDGYRIGIVRGPELHDESGEYSSLAVGDRVAATVLELESERGHVELSFQHAGHQRAWNRLKELKASNETVAAKVISANRGGLLVSVGHTHGFLPVSQLSVEHYPRVDGGDKNKILERLNRFVNQELMVKVIDADEHEEKLIVSERAAWEEQQQKTMERYTVGTTVEGKVTGIVDFGVFVEFDTGLEGLIHISELAWQRIDHPKDIVQVGDTVKATIIAIEGSKISLSMKRLTEDPWKDIEKRYQVGTVVKGKVLKVNPFGLFVELDPEIHGLAHVSELSAEPITDIHAFARSGDILDFKVISIEPREHRLGLSIRALTEPTPVKETEPSTEDEIVDAKPDTPPESVGEETSKENDAPENTAPNA